MQRSKSSLLSILKLPITRQMLRDLVDSLWRDPVPDRYVTAVTFDTITRILTLTRNHDLPALTALIPGGSGGGGGVKPPDVSETPAGDIDGINTDFTLSQTAAPGTLRVYLMGQRQKYGVDYTLPLGVISFTTAPFTGDIITADYEPVVAGVTRVIDASYTGTINGVNQDFVLSVTPVAAYVYLMGARQKPDIDYTLTDDTVHFAVAPFTGDILIIDIEY